MHELRKIIAFVAVFLLVVATVIIANQTLQLAAAARSVDPRLGQVVLYGLMAFYALAVAFAVYTVVRFPAALEIPAVDSPEYKMYLVRLSDRLRRNIHLRGSVISADDISSIEAALQQLDKVATAKIKDISKGVFIATSISQYGKLDGLIVMTALIRMVWQVATVYNQRPKLREMTQLYANVAVTAVAATEMENLVVLENQLEPIFASILGSTVATGASAVTSIAVNSIVQGSANAFLTLRVGAIAKGYSSSITRPRRSDIRSRALVQATAWLAGVVADSTQKVTRAMFRAAGRAGGKVAVAGGRYVVARSLGVWKATKGVGTAVKESGRQLTKMVSLITDFFSGKSKGDIDDPT
ncbi:MAG TPA: DUF697 domain-containing protein [Bacillota bacterium]|nr:DUF697 domain-containing protein [Bacillota bacterium]